MQHAKYLRSPLGSWLVAAAVSAPLAYFLLSSPVSIKFGVGRTAPVEQTRILHVPPHQLDLGPVQTSGHLEISLDVTNRSSAPVVIRRFQTSCDCSGVEPATVSLGAGQSAQVRLKMDLTRSWGPALSAGWNEIPFQATVTAEIGTQDAATMESWRIRGSAVPFVTTTPTQLSFGRHSVLESELPSIAFRLTTRVPTRGVYSRSIKAGWDFRIRPTERPGEYACELRAIDRPALGAHQIEIALRLAGLDATPLPDVKLLIDGEVVPDVQVYPPRLMFGGRTAGTTAEENILVECLSGRPIRLVRVDSTTPGLTATADFTLRSSRHVVCVRRQIDSGDQEGTLVIYFETDRGANESVEVVTQATGFDGDPR